MSNFIRIDGHWFDFSGFRHPGGYLKKFFGTDATLVFDSVKDHTDTVVFDILEKRQVKDPILISDLERKWQKKINTTQDPSIEDREA